MAKGAIYMRKTEFEKYIRDKKEQFGPNPLDWPPHVRKLVQRIEVVQEEAVGWRQKALPYSNTGVTKRGGGY